MDCFVVDLLELLNVLGVAVLDGAARARRPEESVLNLDRGSFPLSRLFFVCLFVRTTLRISLPYAFLLWTISTYHSTSESVVVALGRV